MSTEDFIQFTPVLFEIAEWLKKRHKPIRPELSERQRKELKECFNLIDADGSGAITAEELTDAFQFMNVPVEYDEFVEIMTSSLQNLDVGQANARKHRGKPGVLLPFAILATAYRVGDEQMTSSKLAGD
ncbi:hypothetical protein CYMTET_27520 [Cymbomonas tetramitiformis]|uniref:EF-hand domain-containing protein n=1 Tax=Cymbomonas tetramitiformis TaxID=36881 RepID=A0AAE0KX44_9CHLO|nr:hypothetical protein CYMTET_27520 [Cymbomonas tetramitiformis]